MDITSLVDKEIYYLDYEFIKFKDGILEAIMDNIHDIKTLYRGEYDITYGVLSGLEGFTSDPVYVIIDYVGVFFPADNNVVGEYTFNGNNEVKTMLKMLS